MDGNAQIYPEDDKNTKLTVIDGGLAIPKPEWGGTGGGGIWLLTKVRVSEWFLAAPQASNQIGLLAYQLVGFSPEKRAAYLFSQGEHMWVDVKRFSSTHKLIEVFPDADKRDRSD